MSSHLVLILLQTPLRQGRSFVPVSPALYLTRVHEYSWNTLPSNGTSRNPQMSLMCSNSPNYSDVLTVLFPQSSVKGNCNLPQTKRAFSPFLLFALQKSDVKHKVKNMNFNKRLLSSYLSILFMWGFYFIILPLIQLFSQIIFFSCNPNTIFMCDLFK